MEDKLHKDKYTHTQDMRKYILTEKKGGSASQH